jgi:peptide/nickel transport system substrate-binding protein
MGREARRRLEAYRRNEAGPVESTLIDEALDGEMDRTEVLRRGTVLGLSLPVLGGILAAMGEAPLAFAKPEAVKVGGRIRVGCNPPPPKELDPHLLYDTGDLVTDGVVGEFLTRETQSSALLPELATSWKPNANASVWTFKLRRGVKFQTGQEMTADDVVATYRRLTDKKSGSAALSAFQGTLSPEGVRKVDAYTVAFHLEGPNLSFPYKTSSTTYQAIIVPANYQVGSFEKTPQATGAFMLTSYTPGVGATYERFDGWWGGRAPLDGVDLKYFNDDAALASALLGNQIDLMNQGSIAVSPALYNNPRVQVFSTRASTNRQVPMLTDSPPFNDYRIRQAVALALDRPGIIKTLFKGFASIGNDSPFAPIYETTDKSVPQRRQDIPKARALMAAAGKADGFSVELTTYKVFELPLLAQIIERSVRQIGIKMSIKILTSTAYFGGTSTGPPKGWGTTPWMNTPINITDWGHRAVPDVYLNADFMSTGIWNASHYQSKQYDALAKSYLGAASLKDQKKYAGQIQRLLLHDTPVIFPYFFIFTQPGSKRVRGYKALASSAVYLSKTSLA